MDTLSLLLKLIYQNIWTWSRLISSQEMVLPAVAFATFQIQTTVPVKHWDLSGHGFNCGLVAVLMHMKKGVPGRFSTSNRVSFHLIFHEATVYSGVSQWACNTVGALVLFCLFGFCSAYWKECVSSIDGPCQRPLGDASSYITTPRCWVSFMNTLSSLFGALLGWNHAGHVHQSTEMSMFLW